MKMQGKKNLDDNLIIKRESDIDDPVETELPIDALIEYGIVNIDKPKGPTSHQVAAFVQKILNINKSGHSGTLDPKVTGVLPVAIGRATRIVQTLLISGKEYVGVMHLHKEIEEKKIREACSKFTGEIRQLPPIKSAVKRQERTRKIYYLEIIEIEGQDVLFRVGCQAGTYIRKLCHDIGIKLGCGAHMSELRRTKAGPFDESTLCSLQDLTDAYHYWKNEGSEKYLRSLIQPVESGVAHLKKVWVSSNATESLCHGADLALPGIDKLEKDIEKHELVAVLGPKDELVCLGESLMSSEKMKKDKGMAVRTKKVFMLPGTYPRFNQQ